MTGQRPKALNHGERTELHTISLEGGHEYLDDSSYLGRGGGACRHHGGEYSFAPAAARAGEACRGAAICAADFLRALDLYRHRVRPVCRTVFRLCAGTGWRERAGRFLSGFMAAFWLLRIALQV